MRRLTIEFREDLWPRLLELAEAQRRDPRDEAGLILERWLSRRRSMPLSPELERRRPRPMAGSTA